MSIFRFKQFAVDQTGCAMKVNTDGVLLGAVANGNHAHNILDIGTGTGVIALMMAQRFPTAQIDAVELDETASQTATANFSNSPFARQLQLFTLSFQDFFAECHDKQYDLIVSNPPFYIQSLPSPGAGKTLAKHAGDDFFEELVTGCVKHLSADGKLWLILPVSTANHVRELLPSSNLFVQQVIEIRSFPGSEPHRQILAIGFERTEVVIQDFEIYSEPKIYSDTYRELLKGFLTIF